MCSTKKFTTMLYYSLVNYTLCSGSVYEIINTTRLFEIVAETQSDLGRSHDAANSPLVTMGRPTFTPQIPPFLWTDSQTQLRVPGSSMDLSDLPSQPHPYPISRFAAMHRTDDTPRPADG